MNREIFRQQQVKELSRRKEAKEKTKQAQSGNPFLKGQNWMLNILIARQVICRCFP